MKYFEIVCYILVSITRGYYSESPLVEYLQPDNIDTWLYDDMLDAPDHICTRTCVKGDYKICYYRFVLEDYVTMNGACGDCPDDPDACYNKQCVTADGYERSILTINRKIPGPSIQVCLGDLIIVDVKNMMAGCSTTIHWHGVKQNTSKFMDGVPMVTQCPILESQVFRYHFRANDPGLHFYHSHDGLQKVDGLVGSLVVRRPLEEDPNCGQYDFDLPEHVIVIQDWKRSIAEDVFPGLHKRDDIQQPNSYLIQGRGVCYNTNGTKIANVPIAQFHVTYGYRYVFRIVAGTCYECQYIFTVESHDMVIIGADAQPTQPYTVNSLTMSPGERTTVVINCNRSQNNSYWIQVRAVGYCEDTEAYQVAVLRYRGHDGDPSSPEPTYVVTQVNNPGLTLSPFDSNCTDKDEDTFGPCIEDLRSAYVTPETIFDTPHQRIVWATGFYLFSNDIPSVPSSVYAKHLATPERTVAATMSGVVFEFPPSPILSQRDDIPPNCFCPEDDFPTSAWNVEHRQCLHVFSVPTNCVIEIVVVDTVALGMAHSIHMHGYDMYILEQGQMPEKASFNESLQALLDYLDSDQRKEQPYNIVNKDTLALSSGGYFVARIYTNNTGYWFIHCHFAYHLESGMAAVLQVGDHSEMPAPPAHFPKCGDHLPLLEDFEDDC